MGNYVGCAVLDYYPFEPAPPIPKNVTNPKNGQGEECVPGPPSNEELVTYSQ